MYKFQILTEGGNAGFDYNAVQFYCFTVISMFKKQPDHREPQRKDKPCSASPPLICVHQDSSRESHRAFFLCGSPRLLRGPLWANSNPIVIG
jgi:hypothetical protein